MTPGYERILQLLDAEGINTIFGIPDPSFFHMFNAAKARGWQIVAPHHEQAGGFMAEAMWRMTGKPGVVVGNQGPGVANLLPAALCAAKEHTPTIFIGGQRKRIADQRVRRGRIQYIEQTPHMASIMKYVGVIEYPEQIDEVMHEAFRRALTGTPGPVYVEFPMNVVLADREWSPVARPSEYRMVHQPASASGIATAARLLSEARHPLILLGQGAFQARAHDEIAKLAGSLACPIVRTSGATSFIPELVDRTFDYGFSPAGVAAVKAADVVLAIGTELGEPVHYGREGHWAEGDADRKWILIELDVTAIGVNRPIDVPLVGDLRDIVPQLVQELQKVPRTAGPELDDWIDLQAQYRADIVASVPAPSVPIHPARAAFEATKVIPNDAIYIRDGGATTIYGWTYNQSTPKDLIWNQNFGHLGTGVPYAVGAALATGGRRPVVLISSDSAFLFHISELETAARKKLPIVCVVSCDYAWGLEVIGYRGTFGEGTDETEAHWGPVRLDKIAEGFGARGEYVERAEDIGPAVERALASGLPTVIQVPIDARENATLTLPGYEEFVTWYQDYGY